MDQSFQLLNPLIFLLFAIGFLALHRQRPTPAATLFGLAYTMGAVAFVVDLILFHATSVSARTFAVGLYAATAILISAGFFALFNRRVPWTILIVLSCAHLAIYATLLATDLVWWRSMSAAWGCGAIFVVGLFGCDWRHRLKLTRTLCLVYGVSVLLGIIRPVLIGLGSEGFTQGTHSETIMTSSVHIVSAFAAVSTGMLLLLVMSRELFDELRSMTLTDVLAGTLNRRGFMDALAHMLNRRHCAPVSVVILDIDHFKRVNDQYGHLVGDDVIAKLGSMAVVYLPQDGVAGRLGGEEFALALPYTHLSEAIGIAETLRQAFAAEVFSSATDSFQCTASFGVAQSRGGETQTTLMTRADRSLYLAKDQGRNLTRSEADLADLEDKATPVRRAS
ncbi:MAG: GGDEF domain-containing protein [Pseudomonadota bacterium]